MYYLTPDQEKKLRSTIPEIDSIISSGSIIDARDVMGDQILKAMGKKQEPTKESVEWEEIYDSVIFYMKEKRDGPLEIQQALTVQMIMLRRVLKAVKNMQSDSVLPDSMFCPLLKQEIDEIVCYEIVAVVSGLFKMSSVPEVEGISREEARKICNKTNCPYHSLQQ